MATKHTDQGKVVPGGPGLHMELEGGLLSDEGRKVVETRRLELLTLSLQRRCSTS